MATKNQHEQLVYSAVGSITVILLISIGVWFYVLPKYDQINISLQETNDEIEKYNTLSENGVSYTELTTIVGGIPGKEELSSLLKNSAKEVQTIIKKQGTGDYKTWLNQSQLTEEEKTRVNLQKARINSILPSFNAESGGDKTNSINLRKYISFIENNILAKFNIESNAALGIQNVAYGKDGSDVPGSVGYFDTEISFNTTNANIIDMLKYLSTLGHPDLLTSTGEVIGEGIPEVMSNPLVTIEELSLQSNLDTNRSSDLNSGRVVLRFYVRGSSSSDLDFLAGNVASRKEKLKSRIESALAECKSNDACTQVKEIEMLSKKYNEFIKATANKKNGKGTDAIYSLSAELKSISSLEAELSAIRL